MSTNNSGLLSGILWRRILVYVLGLFILALGVAFAVKSDLGISPINSNPYILSRITGLEQGNLTTLFFCLLILLQILLLRRRFQPIQLLQVVCAMLFGKFVTLCNRLLVWLEPGSYLDQLLLTVISILLISVSMFLYLSAKLIPQPAEGLCLAIQQVFGFRYSNIKVCMDCILVAVAAAITLICTGSLSGLREGTVLTMLTVGKLIGFCMDHWGPAMQRFCFGPGSEQP